MNILIALAVISLIVIVVKVREENETKRMDETFDSRYRADEAYTLEQMRRHGEI